MRRTCHPALRPPAGQLWAIASQSSWNSSLRRQRNGIISPPSSRCSGVHMDRRNVLKALAGLAICPACMSASLAAEGAHWSYEGAGAPAKWGDLDAANKTCSLGAQQSPIDITATIKSQLPALKISWGRAADTIVNNGHTIQLNFAEGSTLKLGDTTYKLQQVHFHRPSTWSAARIFRWRRISCTAPTVAGWPWSACC